MKNGEKSQISEKLKNLPSVDSVLRLPTARTILEQTNNDYLTNLARSSVEVLRREILEIQDDKIKFSRETLLGKAEKILADFWRVEKNASQQRVINATGVVIHTNLGRAPLSQKAIEAITENARYCSLEYDLETGKRGRRGIGAEKLLAEITGAENALIVNNCAAACVLVLTALASGGEAIISRGELVEIGGDFRIPDVMTQSGAILREVGATNRTRLSDYENAINENTRMLVKVHPSNYRIVGFTSVPNASELSELAKRKNILFYEDAGSGALIDLSKFGLGDEPLIAESVASGADVVTFSGDKLLGAAQAGLIVGRGAVIEILRKHPLYRALRANKIIYAALEATLESFRSENAVKEIPVLQMLSMSENIIKKRVENFARKLEKKLGTKSDFVFEIEKGNSVIGGGSAPDVQPATFLLSLRHKKFTVNELEKKLRQANPPIIARIAEDKILFDLRTVSENEESELLEILYSI